MTRLIKIIVLASAAGCRSVLELPVAGENRVFAWSCFPPPQFGDIK